MTARRRRQIPAPILKQSFAANLDGILHLATEKQFSCAFSSSAPMRQRPTHIQECRLPESVPSGFYVCGEKINFFKFCRNLNNFFFLQKSKFKKKNKRF